MLHGYGVDALDDGFMLVLGRSAQQADFPDVPFPRVRGLGAARMHVQGLQVLVQPLGERKVRCAYVVHIDMRAPLPAPMLHFATQRVVGMIFHKLRKEARRIKHGAKESAHAGRMTRDAHIYSAWMLPRMREALTALGLLTEGGETGATPDVARTPSTAEVMAAAAAPRGHGAAARVR